MLFIAIWLYLQLFLDFKANKIVKCRVRLWEMPRQSPNLMWMLDLCSCTEYSGNWSQQQRWHQRNHIRFFKRKSGLWLLKKFCICQIVNRHENSETVQILLFRRIKHRTNKSNKIDKIHPNIQMARPAVTSRCRQYHWVTSTQPAPLTMPQWPWPSAPKDLRPQCFATYPAITTWPRWSWFQMLANNDWISCTSWSRKYRQH